MSADQSAAQDQEQAAAPVAGAFDTLVLIRWLLSQGEKLKQLIAFYDAFKAAETISDKWLNAVRPACDLIVEAIDSLQPLDGFGAGVIATSFPRRESVKLQAEALGVDWNKLIEIGEVFLPLLVNLLLSLRK